MGPAEVVELADVHEFAGSAVGFAGVEGDFAGKIHYLFYGVCQFGDGAVFAGADIDVGEHGVGYTGQLFLWQVHDEHTGGGHVVHMEEFAFGFAAAPDHYFPVAVDFGFVKTS